MRAALLLHLEQKARQIILASGADAYIHLPLADHREEFALDLVAARRSRLRGQLRRGHSHSFHNRRKHDLIDCCWLAGAIIQRYRRRALTKLALSSVIVML